jgi:hypothetical protein
MEVAMVNASDMVVAMVNASTSTSSWEMTSSGMLLQMQKYGQCM